MRRVPARSTVTITYGFGPDGRRMRGRGALFVALLGGSARGNTTVLERRGASVSTSKSETGKTVELDRSYSVEQEGHHGKRNKNRERDRERELDRPREPRGRQEVTHLINGIIRSHIGKRKKDN